MRKAVLAQVVQGVDTDIFCAGEMVAEGGC